MQAPRHSIIDGIVIKVLPHIVRAILGLTVTSNLMATPTPTSNTLRSTVTTPTTQDNDHGTRIT